MAAIEVWLYRAEWQSEFERLAARLRDALGSLALRIDHIGSTSVPGLAAKDVIDVQVAVASLDSEAEIAQSFSRIGFRRSPGDWNLQDHVPEYWSGPRSEWLKLVFGPPEGECRSNVHVRVHGRANERYALLFRDYLRANDAARRTWGEFKRRVAQHTQDRSAYGQIKDPATDLLMLVAESWAEQVGWSPGE